MSIQLGEVLVGEGVLTTDQVEEVLDVQKRTHRPFGVIAEELFNLSPDVVEDAWASQYSQITEHIDLTREQMDPVVLEMIERRQAWQFRMLPIRLDGEEIRVATTREHLLRAMRFALRHFGQACYFVLSPPDDLAEALVQHFPLPGMNAETVRTAGPSRRRPACE